MYIQTILYNNGDENMYINVINTSVNGTTWTWTIVEPEPFKKLHIHIGNTLVYLLYLQNECFSL